eukprot:Awhi_evm2s4029
MLYQVHKNSNGRRQWPNSCSLLELNSTWIEDAPPASANVIKPKWVYKIKRHKDHSIERFKTRLTAK